MPTKAPIVTDRKYLDWLRTEPCLLTGLRQEGTCDPFHIGTAGKGIKNDAEAIPVLHQIHQECHQRGEMTVLREHLPDWLLREALRAYAREQYAEWKKQQAESI